VNESDHPLPAPPAGEEIHLPGPSLLPFLCAIAITLVVVGTTISLIISIVGLVFLVIFVWRWVADTRRDVAELPESHH
jgi:Flp pilus assembly protein TadB